MNIYAVQDGARCAVRYAAVAPGRLVLRSYNPDRPVELLKIHSKGLFGLHRRASLSHRRRCVRHRHALSTLK